MKQKRKTGRKLLAILLTLTMLVGLMPGMGLTAYAAGGGTEVTQANVICQQYSYMDAGNYSGGYYDTPPVEITNIALADAQAFGAAVNCPTTYWVVVYAKDGDNLKWTSNGKTGEQTSTPRSSSLSAWCELYNDDVFHFGVDPMSDLTFYFSKGLATVGVTGVSLDKTTAQTIEVNGAVSFTATVAPDNATDKTVKWSVGGTDMGAVKLYSDEACTTEVGTDATETLTVYAKGESAGSATITCTSNADSEKKASCDVTVNAAQTQTEELLTTITATGTEQAGYSTANVATVSFSNLPNCSSTYTAIWGWWGYGWTATVNAADGYTITKCVFYDDANRTATDSEAPFVVETTEEDKTPQVNGTPILAYTSKGITKIEVYGYATPAHSVIYNTNGGSAVDSATGVTALPDPLPTPIKDGYIFEGWYTDEGLTTAAVAGAEITADTTLYAKWVESLVGKTYPVDGTGKLVIEGVTRFADGQDGTATVGPGTYAITFDNLTDNSCLYRLSGNKIYITNDTTKRINALTIVKGTGLPGDPYVFAFLYDNPISYTVTFSVANGLWDDGTIADKTITLTGYEGDTLKLASDQISAVGSKPNDTYKAGSWDVTPSADTAITADTTYTYTYAQKDTISQTVTFKVVNGSWDEGEGEAATADKTITLTGYEGDTLKLAETDIPAVGTKPNDTYKAGSWDTTPSADTAITADTTYTYTYARKEPISQTVTFKVVNGSWDEGEGDAATADKTVTLTGYEGDTLKLTAGQIPTVGTKPDDTYKAGSWDVTPNTTTAITAATTYIYTYAQKSSITPAVSIEGWTYGETAKSPSVNGNTGNGTVTYTYAKKNTTSFSATVPSDAGEYIVKAVIAETDDYMAGETTADFTIEKASSPTVTVPTPGAVTYDPAKTLTDISLADGWTWVTGTTVPTVVNAGYDAELPVDDANNDYSEVEGYDSENHKVVRTITLTVNKADSTAATVTPVNRTYEGTEISLATVTGDAVGGVMNYALGESGTTAPTEGWSTSIPTATEAGTYYVWYKVVGDANHNSTEPDFVEAKINPVDKTDLTNAIEEAEVYYNTIKDNSDYSEQEEALGSAISTAKSLAENDNVTATEVSEGITAVNSAMTTAKTAVEGIIEAEDTAAAKKVTDAINALPAGDKVTISDKASIEEAGKAYDALTDEQRAKLSADTIKKLTDAKAALKELITIQNVIDMINALPEKSAVKQSDKNAIKAARKAYNELTDEQKAKIDEATLKKLTAAENGMAAVPSTTEIRSRIDYSTGKMKDTGLDDYQFYIGTSAPDKSTDPNITSASGYDILGNIVDKTDGTKLYARTKYEEYTSDWVYIPLPGRQSTTGISVDYNTDRIRGLYDGVWYTTDGTVPTDANKWSSNDSTDITKAPVNWDGTAKKLTFIIPGDSDKQLFESKSASIDLGLKGKAPAENDLAGYPIADDKISYRTTELPTSKNADKSLQYRFRKRGSEEWSSWGMSNKLIGLDIATEYEYELRFVSSDNEPASQAFTGIFKTKTTAPDVNNILNKYIDYSMPAKFRDTEGRFEYAAAVPADAPAEVTDGMNVPTENFYIRYKSEGEDGATGWTLVPGSSTIPDGVAAVEVKTETVKGCGNGELINADSTMEYRYSADGAAWTGWMSCTNSMTGLSAGKYQVRKKKTDNSTASFAGEITLAEGTTATVSVTVRDNDNKELGAEDIESVKITKLNGASEVLKVSEGTPIYTASSLSGGTYTVIVTGTDGHQVTKLVDVISPEHTVDIILPTGKENSSRLVDNTGKNIAVGGIDEEARELDNKEGEKEYVVQLTAEEKSETAAEGELKDRMDKINEEVEKESIYTDSSGDRVDVQKEWFDFSVEKTLLSVAGEEENEDVGKSEKIAQTDKVMEIIIPYPQIDRRFGIQIWRYHGTDVQKFKVLANRPSGSYKDQTYVIDRIGKRLYIYTNRFSTYGITYAENEDVADPEIVPEKTTPEKPNAPELDSKTDTVIKVRAVEGQEYSIDEGETWQTTGEFKGLTPETEYSIVTRITETETSKESEVSDALKVTTDRKADEAVPPTDKKADETVPPTDKKADETVPTDNKAAGDVTVDKVIASINALPASDKVAVTDKAAINAARAAYDALTADQKAKVSADVLKKLTDVEKSLATAEKKAAADKAVKELEAAKEEAQAAMNEQVTVTQKGNKFTVKWKKASSADGYYVYAQYCGKKITKPAKIIEKNTTTKTVITKIGGREISAKKNFRVYVAPYKIIDGKKVTLGKSMTAHLVGSKNTKYSNVKKLTLTKSRYTVKVGKTAKIKAKVTLVNNNRKHIPKSHGAKFRYKSSDTGIATVDKNGKIKGISKGTCTIYVYSINGLMKKVKVTVK